MSVVAVQDLSLSYGKKTLFDQASFALGPRDRAGLVGANGTGKSSLLKIIAGLQQPDSGKIQFSGRAQVGYLPQELSQLPEGSLVASVMSAVPGRQSLESRLADTEGQLAAATDEEDQLELSQTLADLHDELDHFEERHGKHRAERILVGLGFAPEQFGQLSSTFSGGWRMRAALAGLLLQDPDVLLLDEPTNHLDLPTLTWFDDFLRSSHKALIVVSHDRQFMNRQINRVLSLEVEGLRSYAGNYDDYRRLRQEEEVQLAGAAARQAAQRAETEAFIDRFRAKASKARQVQSRIKMLEKQERIEVREERAQVYFHFPEVGRSGREVARFEGIEKAFGANVVYRGLNAMLERGQRVAVVGRNGMGKTTLLKLLAGELTPDAGEVKLGSNVVMAYYAQHHAETLKRENTILAEVSALVPDKGQSFIRGVLGSFLFSGDDVDKPIGVLSGGERARVALAKLLLKPANLMLMDEPTNHLDIASAEALIEALAGYGGTLLFVSHNQSFLNRLATHVWEVKDRQVIVHPGNLEDYLYHLRQETLPAATPEPGGGAAKTGSAKDRRRAEAEARQKKSQVEGPLRAEIARLEKRIAELEAEQKEREALLADTGFYQDFAKAKPVLDAHREGKDELEQLYADWEDRQAKLQTIAS